ncbi:MAG: hypothetical protein NDF51_06410 [archaeon YNP-WB-040]|jgi:adenine/guanine phosphoribosyltransferase-like PRPP-binding protein|nr:hypothetical protein [Candidatus Culexarchaeum yellowstonense]
MAKYLGRYDDLKLRLMVIERLRLLKDKYSYKQLSNLTGIPESVLCRYVKGSVLPGGETALELWKKLESVESLSSIIRSKIEYTPDGLLNLTKIVYNPYIIKLASQYAVMKFSSKKIKKVITAAINGIPLATEIAVNMEKELIVAKDAKEVGIKEFVEASYHPGGSSEMKTLYIPKGCIKHGDEVLIVDDLIRTGRTLNAIVKLVEKNKGRVEGVFALVVVGDKWKEHVKIDCPVEVGLKIEEEELVKRRG